MKILCGLGNKGKEFKNTRHNIGFMVIDKFVEGLGKKWIKKYNGLFMRIQDEEEVILFKPMTFMNLSGIAVGKLLQNLKADPSDMLVIHDEMDIELFKIRLTWNKGDGGHNGIKSIIEDTGTKDFFRLRMGIGREKQRDAVDYVLSEFSQDEKEMVNNFLSNGNVALNLFLKKGGVKAMNFINSGKLDIIAGN